MPMQRYCIKIYNGDGNLVRDNPYAMPDEAMQSYVILTLSDFAKTFGEGAQVALFDADGKLGATTTHTRNSMYDEKFESKEGQAFFTKMRLALLEGSGRKYVITPEQFARAVTDFRLHAQEMVKVTFRDSCFTVEGSREAIDSVRHKYRHAREGTVESGRNEPEGTHFFQLKIAHFIGEMSTDDAERNSARTRMKM